MEVAFFFDMVICLEDCVKWDVNNKFLVRHLKCNYCLFWLGTHNAFSRSGESVRGMNGVTLINGMTIVSKRVLYKLRRPIIHFLS